MSILSIDQLVRELCKDVGDEDYRKYNSILRSVRRGYNYIDLTNVPTIKTARVSLNEYNAISWPLDAVIPLEVAVARQGFITVLTQDPTQQDPNVVINTVPNTTSLNPSNIFVGYGFASYYGQNGQLGEYYGTGGSQNAIGYIRHDQARRETFYKGALMTGDIFIFSYKANATFDGLSIIPIEMEEALRQYVFQDFYRVKSPTVAEKARTAMKQEIHRIRRLYQEMTANDWVDILTKNYKSTPK